ncbi:hypothetical protein [Spirillospora sp. NPDC029432]|uniref:hypothetical protein n=1 Tax=Spirillospora sp. NPDC029432 TaxID=3154599 RepID=UPI0034565282
MRALVIQHDHETEPGHVGARLTERGYDLAAVTVVPESRYHAPDVRFDFPDAARRAGLLVDGFLDHLACSGLSSTEPRAAG